MTRKACLRGLEEAYRSHWLLFTSFVAQLLKVSPKTSARLWRAVFRGRVCLTEAGTRERGEVA